MYLFGEKVEEPVDHPVIRPSVNAVAETYRLAEEEPEVGSAESSLTGQRVNRFLHVTESVDDVVLQNRMQRRLGQRTGTCFQRCVGMDAINSLWSVTHDIDAEHGTGMSARRHQTAAAHTCLEGWAEPRSPVASPATAIHLPEWFF